MRFFRTGVTRGAYFEFQRGEYKKPWLPDSVYIDDEICAYIGLTRILMKVVPDFDPYGITRVTGEDWQRVRELAADRQDAAEAVAEIEWWTKKALDEEGFFTVCGI